MPSAREEVQRVPEVHREVTVRAFSVAVRRMGATNGKPRDDGSTSVAPFTAVSIVAVNTKRERDNTDGGAKAHAMVGTDRAAAPAKRLRIPLILFFLHEGLSLNEK
mmetsp:Transcript_4478/g.9387  ORF Transcript_4478/g.9387 Transcript_4478/m.9387 type:complete len:106 (-) Transcript_4478:208-525(-)